MRYLLISFLFLTSCKLSTVADFEHIKSTTTVFTNHYFSDTSKDYIYKSNIEVYGRSFGGIMIIKKLNNMHHRVVYTTEFGSKIFDFEFLNSNFRINFVLEDLNKKIVVNTLKKDFELLLKEHYNVHSEYRNRKYQVFKSAMKRGYNFFFVDLKKNYVSQLINTSKKKEKIVIHFTSKSDRLASGITIDHKNIKLKIDLKYIGK